MDARWQKLVDDVLWGVEPDDERRARLKQRLRERGDLGILYSMWVEGQDPTAIGKALHHLATKAR